MMTQLTDCHLCHFYSPNPHLPCAIHPAGVESPTCPDFRATETPEDEALSWYELEEQWQPVGASYYNGELILSPEQRLSAQERLELLDWHPLFTGRCPACEMPIPHQDPPQVHWDCEHCG